MLSAGAAVAIAGAGAVTARRTGVLDDGLRAVGVKPHPEPHPGDVRLLATAAKDTDALLLFLATASASGNAPDEERRFLATARSILAEHARAVGGRQATDGPLPVDQGAVTSAESLAAAVSATADDRARDALRAASTDVALVLASMAAGLDQLVADWRRSA